MNSNVTLKQIAEELGLSTMTVSRAINNRSNVVESTRQRVLEAANRMGYTPNYVAKSLVSSKTFTIGLVIPEITHSFFPDVIRGIEDVTYLSDYQLILTHASEQADREKKAIKTLQAKRVDGILISLVQSIENYNLYKDFIKRSNIPLVFFDRCVEGIGASCVSTNDEMSAYQITRHLIGHGYTKIAHLGGPKKVAISKKRFAGFKRALKKDGIALNGEWMVEAGFHEKEGYRAMTELLKLPAASRPEAVVAVNDPAAFGAMEAIYESGLRIPEDMAIVGFSDDIRAKLMACPLTTVRQPAYSLGKKAAEKLFRCINETDEPVENIELVSELVIRQSCGCE
ncbi:MAG: LacI family DNA-binding transcriptional regulator [Balneolales bacterium]